MRLFTRVRLRLRSIGRSRQLEGELDEELRYHLDRLTELNRAGGMPGDEARTAALRAFGGLEQRKEECRDMRGQALVDTTLQDVRFSVRALASNRAFAGLAVLCLSLAIGTNTTVFTFVNALLLRPLPLGAPAQLVSVHETRHQDPRSAGPASYPNFLDWKAQASDVVELAARRTVNVRVSEGGEPERSSGALVSWNFFQVLGVRPARGRGFLEVEDDPGGAPVVLLSHALWRERYGADPAVIGRSITVNGTPRTVVGVMPPELSHAALQRILGGARLWIPIGSAEQDGRRDHRGLAVYARLGEGVTRDVASGRLSEVARRLEAMHPLENAGWGTTVAPLTVGFSARTRSMLLMAVGAVSFVLLIACANVASLTLARATGRRHEIATRLALGAPRSRIVRQLLTESLLVALASVPLGLAIANWGRSLMLNGLGASQELFESIPIDSHVLVFSIGLAIVASVLSGLFPALHAVRRVQHDVLKAGGRRDSMSGPAHTRLSHTLIVGEVALSLILLVGASLFVESFRNLLEADGGFDTSQILAVRVEMEEEGAAPSESTSRRVGDLVDRLEALPGVTHVAAAGLMPLRDGGVRIAVIREGFAGRPDADPTVLLGGVTSNFFGVLNVPILRGRTFSDVEDRSRSAVAVVNETMARRLWPEGNAIGRRFRKADKGDVWFTVVGVSEDILTWDLSNRPLPSAYVPYANAPAREPGLFIRASGDPSLVARPARAAIRALEPALPILDMLTMTDVHYLTLSRNRTLAWLFVALAAVALLLGAAGVYGVLSYFVSQRTHEIGIRAALGADPATLVRLIVRQGMAMTLAGIVLGLAGAWVLARVVRGQLYEVSATDPHSLASVALLLSGIGFLASYVPARRAAAVDPLIAIRE